ncbi:MULTISPECIES: hopanoid biosynthesis-associated protein HpnK [Nostocales]|jgi:hopanoid biosynthesis associated protein HpnK|uniref:ChbG/HpnK family deacetylase n=1 Tax=Dolichospermum flos-aquae UHCC 0037 TaxID=2590026 RepID=A0ACC7SB08_DOLFA|nr:MULTISPECIES: hopanoid biosynthesis-associated protein HpnK [Nostocales]MCX5980241.1 hopanoid biosynthesis-associated protein HpnK [Nostocales cyanobacterium LacPavin_0920_SED1_MAG_38_18]ALB41370.1 hopanoid biosynthesis associated protein HpnK [Anabaena sp. WA102]MBO1065009.1 hopanoid biosynthesis-associated protein HpnK [Anabaena sp. 54]MTJ45713.1 ChbG/HpnK family deacetylase [Dolichospermum flos-aquae UHCC 0037]OBQ18542.1 MAG: hopanoid biosynthesis associated protein HpnK [Anabaena sp. AL
MSYLIINADDFGFSQGVNAAIIQAHEEGVLTSTSLMVSGDAAQEAIALAKDHPQLAVGLHLVLVCGKSVLPPSQIPHLVDSQGNFSSNPTQAGLSYQFNQATRAELRLEISAQLEKFRDSGLNLAHVDGHLHLHVHPVILNILTEFAAEFQIKFIRLPSEELSKNLKIDNRNLLTKIVWSIVFGQLRRYGEGLLKANNIKFADRVYGLLQTGDMSEKYLLGLIPQIESELVEIYSHPALVNTETNNGGEVELAALLSQEVRQLLTVKDFKLSNYNQLI